MTPLKENDVLLSATQILGRTRDRIHLIHDAGYNLPFRPVDKHIHNMLLRCTNDVTQSEYFEQRKRLECFTLEDCKKLPKLSPNQIFERLYQLTKRQKPLWRKENSIKTNCPPKGFLLNHGLIIGKTEQNLVVILYLDKDASGFHWAAHTLDTGAHLVCYLV